MNERLKIGMIYLKYRASSKQYLIKSGVASIGVMIFIIIMGIAN